MGENGLLPCAQDGFEGLDAMTALKKPLVWNSTTMTCDTTAYTMYTETFWVLWGHPQDTYELTKRTGSAPVVTFPLVRGPYPSYSSDGHGDDASDLYPKIKEWLVYLGAFSESELDGYDVEPSEGAEQGVVAQIGAMAAYIARQTCNRDIYILSEAPSYGYSLSTAAKHAEKLGGFLDGCSTGDTISISMVGWLPGTDFPERAGADGIMYKANSMSPNSPWMESLVFPENPSGTIKTPQLPANRRVCDACYIYPMFFGQGSADTSTWHIPDAPDCMSWAGSVTKVYSASVRAGYVIYKNDDAEWAGLMKEVMDNVRGMPDGLMSEWTWWGQIQILDQMMAKPYTSPESWIGAYIDLMQEKWKYLIDGFSGCSDYITLTNSYMGAYGWFKLEGAAKGKESNTYSSFFSDVLGVKTTTPTTGASAAPTRPATTARATACTTLFGCSSSATCTCTRRLAAAPRSSAPTRRPTPSTATSRSMGGSACAGAAGRSRRARRSTTPPTSARSRRTSPSTMSRGSPSRWPPTKPPAPPSSSTARRRTPPTA